MSDSELLTRFLLPRSFRDSIFARNGNTFLYFEQEVKTSPTDGFQSEILLGRIVFKDASGDVDRTPPILLKTFPVSFQRNSFSELTFANEILVYNKLLPFYATLNDYIWNLFPKFYFANLIFSEENENGFVALENLNKIGYRSAESRLFLDFAHLRLMMKKLGEFHAYSYLAKNSQPKQFYALVDNLIETSFSVVKTIPKFVHALHEIYMDLLSDDERYAGKIEKLKEIVGDADNFIADIYTTRNEPNAVLCHGDFLRNNVLFRYDSENHPVDMKFIDVANMRYCSPVVDLALVLYMNSDQITRDKYWDELVDVYYKSLQSTFPQITVPSKSELLLEFKCNSLQSYLLVMFFLPAMFRQEEIDDGFFLSGLFSPDYEDCENKPVAMVSSEAFVYAHKKLQVGKGKKAVLDVIMDILNKNFI